MRAKIFLADFAQPDANGKVSAIGLGWSVTSSPTPPGAVVVLVDVPWDQANEKHKVAIELLDEDGNPAQVSSDASAQKGIKVEVEFETGRPAGLPHGTYIGHPVTVNLAPGMALPKGRTYEWRLTIDGQHGEGWSAPFFVRP